MTRQMSRTRPSAVKNWTFTLNNWTPDEAEKLRVMFEHGHFNYLLFGREVGQDGTPHLQGFAQTKKRLRFKQMKQILGSRCHIEPMLENSSPRFNVTYCKKDGDFEEFGTVILKAGMSPNYYRLFITHRF